MFKIYNLELFGREMKRIRNNCRITQNDIYEQTGINPDTIRKLEKGFVIPKYETLEKLSQLYKVDLLNTLRQFRVNQILNDLYLEIDKSIVSNDTVSLRNLEERIDIKSNDTTDFVNIVEIKLLRNFIKYTVNYHKKQTTEKEREYSINGLTLSLEESILGFKLKNLKTFKYNHLEIRVLILIGLLMVDSCQYTESNEILEFCLVHLSEHSEETNWNKKLIIKLYLNLSYNYHLTDNHQCSYELSDKGITFTLENDLLYCLPHLIARKGIAEYYLNNNSYLSTLSDSIQLFKISNNHETAEIYKKVLLDKYSIEII